MSVYRVAMHSAARTCLLLLLSPALMAAEGERPVAPMSRRAQQVYVQTEKMMPDTGPEVGPRMLDLLLPVARREPHALLLGRLVVAAARIANADPGGAKVDALLRAADEHPDDPIANFVAGVAVHYRGHTQGRTRAAKKADYERAIRYLEPLVDVLGRSPRLWIYLAISYRRTGRQEEAEAAIARAHRGDVGEDADVWYCESEIYHGKAPRRALAAVDRYLDIMARNHAKGAYTAPRKEAAVRRMRAHLVAVLAGEEEPAGPELFDPLAGEDRPLGVWPAIGWALLLLLGPPAIVVGVARGLRARRCRRQGPRRRRKPAPAP